MVSKEDMQVLRELGARYMEIATLPIQKEKIRLWKALNRGEMQRPMVVMDQLPIPQMLEDELLQCKVKDDFWRWIEWEIRIALYRWEHFPVDMVVDPFITIPKAVYDSGYGLEISKKTIMSHEDDGCAAQEFEISLQEWEDLEKIKDKQITHDEVESARRLEEAKVIFDGVAPVRLAGGLRFHLGVWDELSQRMGVENIYYDLYDRPEFLHAAMEKMTNSVLAGIRQGNELGVFDDIINTCHCSYIYTDELLPDSGAGKGPLSSNSWAFGLAQLFSSVSPSITEEFELPYITKMAEQFGMIYYGCCDRLDDRLDIVKRIPNVKKISCSPWSDKRAFAEKIGPKLVMSNKPNPAFVATDVLDEDIIRRDLAETMQYAKENNANLEFILKDISTVRGDVSRLDKWADIAMKVVESY